MLLPIAYLLLASPVLLFLSVRFRRYVIGATALLVFACWYLQVRVTGLSLINLGLLGFMAGTLTLTSAANSRWSQIVNAAAFLVFLLAQPWIPHNFATFALNIVLILKFLYDLAEHLNLQGFFNRFVVLFGQYSLVCYIVQIAFLQILYRSILRHRLNPGIELVLVGLTACMVLVTACVVLRWLRKRSTWVNSTYKSIFA